MLTSTDFVEDSERQYILNLAPAEGSRLLSVLRDEFSQEMAYPYFWARDEQKMIKGEYLKIR